jgi:hypothetical protein
MTTPFSLNRKLGIHLALWLYLFILPFALLNWVFIREIAQQPHLQHQIILLAIYRTIVVIAMFYLNYTVLMPRLFFKQRYWQYGLLVVGLIIAASALQLTFSHPPPHPFSAPFPQPNFSHEPPPPFQRGMPPYMFSPLAAMFMMVISLFASFAWQLNRRYQEAMQVKLASELSWLKAQINPHFLFNALNSIYLLSLKKSDQTANSIIQLSEMMRYILSEANENRIALEKEIAYLNNYIAIQKLRLAPTVALQYDVKGDVLGKQIAPLLLISFIENAFKYGISTTEASPIDIIIQINDKKLLLHVKNRHFGHEQALSVGTGIGLDNTQKRLSLFYPNKHQLKIQETDNEYCVDLVLDL